MSAQSREAAWRWVDQLTDEELEEYVVDIHGYNVADRRREREARRARWRARLRRVLLLRKD